MDDPKPYKTRKIPASRELQNKVGTGKIAQEDVAAAQDVIETNGADFEQIAMPHIDELARLIFAVQNAEISEREMIEAAIHPIMNLKANAGTFNYPLITTLAEAVLGVLDNTEEADQAIIDITDHLQKAVLAVMRHKMFGDGGVAGAALVKEFEDVCRRYVIQKNES